MTEVNSHAKFSEDSLNELKARLNSMTAAAESSSCNDADLMRELIASPVIEELIKTVDCLANRKLKYPSVSERHFNRREFEAALAILEEKSYNPSVVELLSVLDTTNFRALVVTYDGVARHQFEPQAELVPGATHVADEDSPFAYRIVGMRIPRNCEHLGLTVREEFGQLVVARILEGSPIATQGLIHVGDVLLEVNGVAVKTADHLHGELSKCQDGVNIKLIPSPFEIPPATQAFVKPYFNYNPVEDKTIPCPEIGLPFSAGEILQVINKEDEFWWQARKVAEPSRIGLIPSQELEESRKAVCPADRDMTKKQALGGLITIVKKRRVMYSARRNSEFDKHELLTYEEVGRLSPFSRKVLVLVGAPGVGRRTLKSRLLRYDPMHFATVVPYTSRAQRDEEVNGREYHFVPRESMQKEIENGSFLEWGEFNHNLYGTRIDSINQVIKSGRMCVLDCSPQAIKFLYSWEFMPYIVFIRPPEFEELKELYETQLGQLKMKSDADLLKTCEESDHLESVFRHLFDLSIVNRNSEATFRRLLDALEALKSQPQWVPISWLYG